MRLNLRKYGVLACALLSFNSFASIQYIFDFVNDDEPTISHELDFIEQDLLLSISAWTTSHNSEQEELEPWQQVLTDENGIFYADRGLGLFSHLEDSPFIDGGSSSDYSEDPDEGFLLQFNKEVSLFGISFDFITEGEDDINISMVDFASDGSLVLTQTLFDVELFSPFDEIGFIILDAFEMSFTGSNFMIWVDGNDDSLSLLDVVVTRVSAPQNTLLCCLALCMFGIRRASK